MSRKKLIYESFAKINLCLEIKARRNDGYHQLRSVFQTISLCDELSFSRVNEGIHLHLEGAENQSSLYHDNIITRTAVEIKNRYSISNGVEILLKKRIPVGAGLGGGSSNAFITIKALNKLWDLGLSPREFLEIALKIGSDVPFFHYGGTVLVEGRGERLKPLDDISPLTLIIVRPKMSISTASAYRWWDEAIESQNIKRKSSGLVIECPGAGDIMLYNDFESVIFPRFPVIEAIKQKLLALGCSGALLSGSGSCVFGVADSVSAPPIVEKIRECEVSLVALTRSLRRSEIV